MRKTISEKEQFTTAAYTFRNKYGGLPGDLRNAAAFGFEARSGVIGDGDNNRRVESSSAGSLGGRNNITFCGENSLFWDDLSSAGLINGDFSINVSACLPEAVPDSDLWQYFPHSDGINGCAWIISVARADKKQHFFLGNIRQHSTPHFGVGALQLQPVSYTHLTLPTILLV